MKLVSNGVACQGIQGEVPAGQFAGSVDALCEKILRRAWLPACRGNACVGVCIACVNVLRVLDRSCAIIRACVRASALRAPRAP